MKRSTKKVTLTSDSERMIKLFFNSGLGAIIFFLINVPITEITKKSMSSILAILFVFVLIITQTWQPFCAGSLFIKEDQVCDPMGTNIVVYTGFRFTRQYTFIPPQLSVLEPLRAGSAADTTTRRDPSLRRPDQGFGRGEDHACP